MKTIAQTLILALVTLAGAAQASYIPGRFNGPSYLARLNSFQIEHRTSERVDAGTVLVNLANKTISLNLMGPSNCPANARCFWEGRKVALQVEVALTSQTKDDCGNITYLARKDLRRVDGNLEELRVVDHTKNTCPTLVAYPDTEVVYTSTDARNPTNEIRSVMTGDKLQLLLTTMVRESESNVRLPRENLAR